MNPEQVLFFTYGFPVGGAEMFFVNLLNTLDRSKIKPLVASLGEGEELMSRLEGDIRVIRLPRRWRYDLSPAVKLRHYILENNVTKVVALELFCCFYVIHAARKMVRPPTVLVSLHMTKPRSLRDFAMNYFYSRFLTGREILTTVCEAQATYLSSLYTQPRQRFRTVYNGVDVNHWTPIPEENQKIHLRKELLLPPGTPVIVQVAALRPEKRHEDSIRALRILHDRSGVKPCLAFVGGGNAVIENRLRTMVRRLALGENVVFCGQQDDVRKFYWAADLFTLSSRAIETFSIAALEAMSTGLPCVITDLGGAREMVFDGKNGYVISPGSPEQLADAWQKVLSGALGWEREQIRGHVANSFSLEHCVRQYEDIICRM